MTSAGPRAVLGGLGASLVDEVGRPLSPRVELLHDLPPEQGKGCRWVDWRRS